MSEALIQALNRYASYIDQLADIQTQLGELRAASIRARHGAFMGSNESSVTGRRDAAQLASHAFDAEAAILEGNRDALVARLRYLDQYIAYLTRESGD